MGDDNAMKNTMAFAGFAGDNKDQAENAWSRLLMVLGRALA